MFSIDLNSDTGEIFGAWKMGSDAELMNYVSSVSVACGFHAGDAKTIRQTIEAALEKNVAVGAHPSFPDLQGFGRRAMSLAPEEIFDLVLYQISAVKGICEALGGKLNHVKPHGALYNQAAKDKVSAEAICQAVFAVDKNLVFYGLSGSFLISEAAKIGLPTASEVFADRTYQNDGSLTARTEPNAMIKDTATALSQILQMVQTQTVQAVGGEIIPICAETVCIHGDGENAVEFARTIRDGMLKNNVRIQAIKR